MEWEHTASESKSSQRALLQNNGEFISNEIPHCIHIYRERKRELRVDYIIIGKNDLFSFHSGM